MRFAYADPPYPGQAAKHYADHADYGGEVDLGQLIHRLVTDYPDGWALSTSSPALRDALPLCPAATRVCAWVKPFHVFKKGVRPAYAWEPVLICGGRNPPDYPHASPPKHGQATTPKDWLAANVTLRRGLVGVKPEVFCHWLFALLGAEYGDTLDDLFPGSGVVGQCWQDYQDAVAGRFTLRQEVLPS